MISVNKVVEISTKFSNISHVATRHGTGHSRAKPYDVYRIYIHFTVAPVNNFLMCLV